MFILSQILVVVSDIFFIISMLNSKKKNLVFYLIISTILFACHYMCLGGWTGAAIAWLELVYLILMYVLELKDKTAYGVCLSIATIVLTAILSLITWNTWISVLPMLAMIVYLTTMMFKKVIIVKSGALIRLTLNAIYMLILKSYFGAVLSVVIILFTIVGMINDYKNCDARK